MVIVRNCLIISLRLFFSNFNGTSGDVDVLTHEAGHAFAAYQARNMEIRENAKSTTMETAEVHSMTMELLARPLGGVVFWK